MKASASRSSARRIKRAFLLGFLLVAVPAVIVAQGLTPEQVVRLESVTSVAMSPDGEQVAYTLQKLRGENDSYGPAYVELWVVPARGGSPRPIVRGPNRVSQPSWSPDGRTLSFAARLGRRPATQVYGIPARGGDPRVLTHSRTGVLSYAWSPTGDALAYTEREPVPEEVTARQERGDDAIVAGENQRHVRLWIETLDTGERRAVTPVRRTVWNFAWSPDARRLAVQTTASPAIDDSYMFRELATVHVTGGGLERLVETPGKLEAMAWSPDGSRLAFVGAVSTNDPLAQSVFIVPAEGGAAQNRTNDYGGSVTGLSWADDGTLLFLANEGTRTTLNRLAVDQGAGAAQRVAGGGPEILSSVRLDANAHIFAAVASTSSYPSEVHVGSIRDGALERVTRHNTWLDEVQLAQQETVEWTHPDGTRIEGVLLHPLNEQPGVRYPLAVLPHGGPEGISRDGWTTSALYPAQVLAARGYAVLMPNYRGSAGRGVGFSKGDHRDLGGKEFEDVIAGIDHLAERGLVDPERVGSSGTSYGGYFSAWAGTRHADRFKAAITFAGISNWASFTGTTDIPYEMSLVHWDLWWFDDPELAWDRSPLAHVSKDNSPTLVAHGAADERVHPEQSQELYQTLKILGVPTGLIVYPREPHGLRERAHQLDFMTRVIEWFDRYVKNAATTTE